MAGDGEGKKDNAGQDSPGGNIVDGLTPLTMKYPAPTPSAPDAAPGSEIERTQIGPAPSLTGQPNSLTSPNTVATKDKARYAVPSMTGKSGADTMVSGIEIQDLSSERLLRDAPRIESNGRLCPSLNGIPILAKIGQGGMGAVFYGVHPRLRSEVAIKVLPFHLAEQDPGMIQRFFREAQIAAQVRSPHLVNVMDVNEESGLFFLVMEFVPGCTAGQYLKRMIEEGKPGLTETDTLDIIIGATEGLNAAHVQSIVHRDLKPDNIMVPFLSRAAKTYNLKQSKLMDLGLARSEESSQSLTGAQAAMGTPGYMAPEQALDAKTADKRSDVFGMGATIYALLNGKPPFRGEAIMKVLMATMHEPHVPIINVRPDVSKTLSEIVDRCLDKKQENRYQDALQLLRALKNCRRLGSGGSDDDIGSGTREAVSPSRNAADEKTMMTGGSGLEKTFIQGAGGAAESAGGLAGVQGTAQGKKGMLYVAAGVAAVVIGGGAFFALSGRTNPANPSNIPGLPKPPGLTMESGEILAKKKKFKEFIVKATKAAEKLEQYDIKEAIDDAQATFDKLPLNESADLKKDLMDVQELLVNTKKKIARKEKIDEAQLYISKRDYLMAGQILNDDVFSGLSAEEELAVKDKKDFIKSRLRYNDLIKEIQTFSFEQVDAALKKMDEATLLAKSEDEKEKIKSLKGSLDVSWKYQDLMKQVVDAENNQQNIKLAYDKAEEAEKLLPKLLTAKDAKIRLSGRLEAARTVEEKKIAADLKFKAFDDAYNSAKSELDQGHFDAAENYATFANNNAETESQKSAAKARLDSVLAAKIKDEDSRKQARIKTLVKEAEASLVESTDVNVANEKVTTAKLLDVKNEDMAIIALENKLVDYATFIKKASEALDKKPQALVDASEAITQAKKIAPCTRDVINLELRLKKSNIESSAQQTAIKNQTEYNRLVLKGDGMQGSKSYTDALSTYEEARKFADSADVAKLQVKIDGINKLIQSMQDVKRKSVLDDVEQKLTSGDLEGAQKVLAESKKYFSNDAIIIQKERDVQALIIVDKEVTSTITDISIKLKSGKFAQVIIDELAKSPVKNSDHHRIKNVVDALKSVRQIEIEVQSVLETSDKKMQEINKRLKESSGQAEIAQFDSAKKSLQNLVPTAIAKLIQDKSKTDTTFIQTVKTDQSKFTNAMNAALVALEKLVPKRIPDPDPTIESGHTPEKEKKQPPPQTQKEKQKTGSVGEVNVDD